MPIGDVNKIDGSTVNIEFGRYNFEAESHDTPVQYAKDGGWNAEVATSGLGFDETTYEETIKEIYYELPTTEGTNRESNFAVHVPNSNATALNLEKFVTTSIENGGYYIARYEASFGSGNQISSVTNGSTSAGSAAITNQVPYFKQSTSTSSSPGIATVTSNPGMLWNYVRQGDASLACRNLYAGNEYNNQDFVQCDLINSYAWDTAIVFIEKCSDKMDYANQVDGNGTIHNTGETTDNPCNIYDMSGNLSEWTTEYSSDTLNDYSLSCVYRGGVSGDTERATAFRGFANATDNYGDVGFRGVLYCNPVG